MADDTRDIKSEEVDEALGDMKIGEGQNNHTGFANGTSKHVDSRSSTPAITKSSSQSPVKRQSASTTPKSEIDEDEEVIGGDIVVTVEPGKAPKLSRKSSQKITSRAPMLFDHVPDATDEALTVFQRIKDCIYGSKYMGASEHDALDCDCSEEWSKCTSSINSRYACANIAQMTAATMHAEKIRTASIVPQKWNVWMVIAIAVLGVKISVSSSDSTPMFQSSRRRRKDMAYEPILIYKQMTSSSSTLERSSMSQPFAAE
jgi:histone-lysine N-methyltransferase SETD2